MRSQNSASLFDSEWFDLCYQAVYLDIHVEGWLQWRAAGDRAMVCCAYIVSCSIGFLCIWKKAFFLCSGGFHSRIEGA